MPKVDNDDTKYLAQPFVICAQRRAGGTYLSHCLSNHPQVYCDRAETVHHASVWRRYARKLPVPQLIDMLCHQEGYHASGIKLVYTQFFEQHAWARIREMQPPARIIHLTRDNKLRQATSIVFNQIVRKGKAPYYPVHTTKHKLTITPTEVNPKAVVKMMQWLDNRQDRYAKALALSGLEVLHMTYGEMVGGEGPTVARMKRSASEKTCDFLGVRRLVLKCDLKRVHSHPLSAWLSNYKEFSKVISNTKYARFLNDERTWEGKHARH